MTINSALERNRAFAAAGGHEGAVVFPKLRLFVITCLDPRVDPAHFLGLGLSDAMVVRNVGGRVKRWKNAQMILRWTTAAVSAAATRFRSIAGHKSMPILVKILRDRDHSTSSVEPKGKAA